MERKAVIHTTKPEIADLEQTVGFPGLHDGWEESFMQLLKEKGNTEELAKEYIRNNLPNSSFLGKEQSSQQKYEFGQLVNEVYDKFTSSLNPEDFVNATAKTLNMYMTEDYLIAPEKFFASELDREMYCVLNEYTGRDMMSILLEMIEKKLKEEQYRVKKYRSNIDSYIDTHPAADGRSGLGGEDKHPSFSARSKEEEQMNNKLKMERDKIELDVVRLEEEVSLIQKYQRNFKGIVEAVRGTFEKPNFDISARVKFTSLQERHALEELLFTMEENKDMIVSVTQNQLTQLLVHNMLTKYKTSHMRILLSYTKTIPYLIYSQYLALNPQRLYTRFDMFNQLERSEMKSENFKVYNLDAWIRRQDELKAAHPSEACSTTSSSNFYEKLMSLTGEAPNFKKVIIKGRTLSNFMMSEESMIILMNTIRHDDQKISKSLKEVLGIKFKKSGLFKEAREFPSYILEIVADSVLKFDEDCFSAVYKMNTDSTEGSNAAAKQMDSEFKLQNDVIFKNNSLLEVWHNVLTDVEKLELFNYKIEEMFVRHFKVQLGYLEFEDYYAEEKVIDIDEFGANLNSRNKSSQRNSPTLGLLDYLNADSKIKIKAAFWVKESLLYKVTQKQPNEHHSTILLKEQMKHPQTEVWMQLALNNDIQALLYDLDKFTENLFEVFQIRQDELKTEKKLTTMTVKTYVKLMLLRTRNASIKLLSYANFNRSLQKFLNLRFTSLYENSRDPSTPLQSEEVRSYRKEEMFKHSGMFNKTEYAEVKDIFGEQTYSHVRVALTTVRFEQEQEVFWIPNL